MSNQVIFGFIDEVLQKRYGDIPKVNETNENNLALIQEKEQVKNELISKENEKLFVEYLGKDSEKWPSSADVESELKLKKEERRKVKEQLEEEKEKIEEALKVVVEEYTVLQRQVKVLEEKLILLEDKKHKFEAAKQIDPETVDISLEKCERCIQKLEAEIQQQKPLLQNLKTTIVDLKSQLTTTGKLSSHRAGSQARHAHGNQSVDRTKKILSFVQTVAGVHVHTVQPNKIQIHFLKGNEELKLVLTLTLKDDNQGNPVLCDVKTDVDGFSIDDIIHIAMVTNDIPYLVTKTQERWLHHFPLLSEMDILIKQHAVDWIQEENKLRVLIGKCGKIMFTLNIPKDYPNSRDITLDNACGLEDITEHDIQLPQPPASLLQWVRFLEDKYGDS